MDMDFSAKDPFEKMRIDYESEYERYGVSHKSLKCFTDKRNIRYYFLTKNFHLNGSHILDVGCGFGDLVGFLKETGIPKFRYTGVDMVEAFVVEGKKKYGNNEVSFTCGNFLTNEMEPVFDYGVVSGIFNCRMEPKTDSNYDFVYATIKKGFSLCDKGFSFNFYTDKVDFKKDKMAYHSPEKLLAFAFDLTKNVIFDNTYAPFEATMTLLKDDSFSPKSMLFHNFEKQFQSEFEKGLFALDLD